MKVQRDEKFSAAVRRQTRGGEKLRFSPGNWACAQFLTDFSAACRQRESESGEKLRFSPRNWTHVQFLTNLMPPNGGRKG